MPDDHRHGPDPLSEPAIASTPPTKTPLPVLPVVSCGGSGRSDALQAEVAELRREVGESREMLGAIAGKLDQLLLAGTPLSA